MKEIDALRAARDYIKSLPGPLTLDRYNTLDKINAAISEATYVQEAGYEHRRAIMEGERNESAEEYFKARPQIDFINNRRIFEDGFRRGYDVSHPAPVPAVPQVPCPVCGGEAKDHQDALRRVYFVPASLVTPTSSPQPQWRDENDYAAIDAILSGEEDTPATATSCPPADCRPLVSAKCTCAFPCGGTEPSCPTY